MQTRVQEWGNNLALRIPKAFAEEMAIMPDSTVDISIIDGKMIVTVVAGPRFSLEELLAGITEENIHDEVDTGWK